MKNTPVAATPLLRSAIEAALILAVGMGFGRFAFTAIYPHMVEEGLLSLSGGSLAASANYAGYLLGAILGMRVKTLNAHRVCLWSTLGTAGCLALVALLDSTWGIVTVRGIAGMFSSLSMVAASLWLLGHRKHQNGAPLLYAGVGVGIALSAELLVLGAHAGLHSKGQWVLLAAVSLLIGLLATPGLAANTPASADAGPSTAATTTPALVRHQALLLVYGIAGFGYIITATYLPVLVKTLLPGLNAAHVWAVFGLGAAPSCFLWHKVHAWLGTRRALVSNLALQSLGVLMPVILPSASGFLLSALLVGGTFVGTVTIALPAAQRISRHLGRNLMAQMTVLYSVGQILGPVTANYLYSLSHSFTSSLLTAAAALMLAALLGLSTL